MTITDNKMMEDTGRELGLRVTVLSDRCAGCQECSIRCPTGALTLDPGTWTVVADDAACVGCRQCVRTCPFTAIYVDGQAISGERVETRISHPDMVVGDFSETRLGISSWQEALAEAARCLQCPDPTCVRGCPAHNDIPGFISAIAEGDLNRAHEVLRRTTIMPDVCSRVCDQALQCEGSCSWALAGERPVAIGALERFIADNSQVPPVQVVSDTAAGMKVAVIGSGPAAAAASWDLVESGASVTVFEKDDAPGGLLRWGIPDFTLPSQVARRAWDALIAAGVEVKVNHPVPASDISSLKEEFDAVVVAAGAGSPLRLGVPGSDLNGVWDATRFLTEARDALEKGGSIGDLYRNTSQKESTTKVPTDKVPTVLVLGAGNTAMDTARMARRLGANAICIDWMDRKFAPVRPDELREAEEEGVEVRFLATLSRLEASNGAVSVAVLSHTRQSRKDRPPEVVAADAERLPIDMVVMAMGYRIDPEITKTMPTLPVKKSLPNDVDRRWIASGIMAAASAEWSRQQAVGKLALGREQVRQIAGMPVAERVWVVGDSLVGPSTVVEAMAQGKQAARGIIDHGPRRGNSFPKRILVTFDSRSGHTRKAAEVVAGRLSNRGSQVITTEMANVGLAELQWAELLVLGTWAQGLVVAGVKPSVASSEWISKLPDLGGIQVAIFCTFAFSPSGALRKLNESLASKGAEVIASSGISRRRIEREAADFAGSIVRFMPSSAR